METMGHYVAGMFGRPCVGGWVLQAPDDKPHQLHYIFKDEKALLDKYLEIK